MSCVLKFGLTYESLIIYFLILKFDMRNSYSYDYCLCFYPMFDLCSISFQDAIFSFVDWDVLKSALLSNVVGL